MGDVIQSRRHRAGTLKANLKELVTSCNEALSEQILSPYTITLGDEFQGVASSLQGIVRSLFFLEEARLEHGYGFRLHYIAHRGEIQTPINPSIAYEMMGPGLTKARELLTRKQRNRPRFHFDLPDQALAKNLNRLFRVVEGLDERWQQDDYALISAMLRESNNETVASEHGKNRSQIWKRRKSLLIEEYRLIKEVILDVVGGQASSCP